MAEAQVRVLPKDEAARNGGLFASVQPEAEAPAAEAAPAPALALLEAVAAILAARSLALIALLGSVGVWLWAAYDPQPLRLYAGLGVSLAVLVPCLMLYHKTQG
jgi:hypothetical protein